MGSLKFSWLFLKHYLFSKKSNSLVRVISRLCIAGTAVGVLSLVLILSIMEDFGQKIQKRLFTFTPHLMIDGGIDSNYLEELKKDFRIKEVKTYVQQDVMIRSQEGLLSGAIAKGYDAKGFQSFLNLFKDLDLFLGGAFLFDISHFKKKDVLMSLDLIHSMDLVDGDRIFLILPESLLFPQGDFPRYETLNVKGSFSTDLFPIYSRYIFYNFETSLKVFEKHRSQEKGIELFLKDKKFVGTLQEELKKRKISFVSWKDQHTELFFALKMEKLALTLFLLLSLLITSFSILTLLIFLISQKKRDIGMLMTMGLSPRETMCTFTWIGVWISSFGIWIGAFLGVLLAYFLKIYPLDLLPSKLYYDSFISAEVNWIFVICVISFSFILSWMGSRLTSQFYIRLNPAEALRKERAV